MPAALSILSLGPKVTKENGKLRARTSLPFALLTLGLSLKSMEADPQARRVVHRHRLFWLIPLKKEVSFDEVKEVTYTYENLLPLSSVTANDAIDCFKIALDLHDHREVVLFHWIGAGTFENNSVFPDWYYWDEQILDLTGTQESESQAFFTVLRQMVAPPRFQSQYTSAPAGGHQPATVSAGQKPAVRPAPPPR